MYLKERMIGWGGGDLPSADHPEWPQQPGLCQGTARIQELHTALLDRFHKDPHTQVTKCCLSRHMCREQDQKQSWWDCNMHWDIGFWYCNRQLITQLSIVLSMEMQAYILIALPVRTEPRAIEVHSTKIQELPGLSAHFQWEAKSHIL